MLKAFKNKMIRHDREVQGPWTKETESGGVGGYVESWFDAPMILTRMPRYFVVHKNGLQMNSNSFHD